MKKSLILICVAISIISCQPEYQSVNPVNEWSEIKSYPSKQANNIVLLQDSLITVDNSSSPVTFYTGTQYATNWNKINSSFGSITSIIAHGGALYCGTANSGIYYSNDFSRSWVQKNNGLPNNFNVADLITTNAGLYVCGTGLYTSIDNGDTWNDISIPGTDQVLSVVYLDHTLIASTNKGLYNSQDNGKNWSPVYSSSGISNASINTFAVFDNAIYAASGISPNAEIYASYDKGNTWVKGYGLSTLGANAVYSFEFFNGVLYAATTHGVFESDDNGRHWIYSGCDNTTSLLLDANVLYSGTVSQGISTTVLKF